MQLNHNGYEVPWYPEASGALILPCRNFHSHSDYRHGDKRRKREDQSADLGVKNCPSCQAGDQLFPRQEVRSSGEGPLSPRSQPVAPKSFRLPTNQLGTGIPHHLTGDLVSLRIYDYFSSFPYPSQRHNVSDNESPSVTDRYKEPWVQGTADTN
jgi:hypothetical protein